MCTLSSAAAAAAVARGVSVVSGLTVAAWASTGCCCCPRATRPSPFAAAAGVVSVIFDSTVAGDPACAQNKNYKRITTKNCLKYVLGGGRRHQSQVKHAKRDRDDEGPRRKLTYRSVRECKMLHGLQASPT